MGNELGAEKPMGPLPPSGAAILGRKEDQKKLSHRWLFGSGGVVGVNKEAAPLLEHEEVRPGAGSPRQRYLAAA